jgi:hypothetical protein
VVCLAGRLGVEVLFRQLKAARELDVLVWELYQKRWMLAVVVCLAGRLDVEVWFRQ